MLLDNLHDVAYPTTEIRDSDDVLESTPLTTEQVVDTITPMVTVSGIPPLDIVSPTTEPLQSDNTTTQISQPPPKRRRLDKDFWILIYFKASQFHQ